MMGQLAGDAVDGATPAVLGESTGHAYGVIGRSTKTVGVLGQCLPGGTDGVVGLSFGSGAGVRGEAIGDRGAVAGAFTGDVIVSGEIRLQKHLKVNGNIYTDGDVQLLGSGMDLAEPFTVEGDDDAQPGSVMVLAGPDRLRVSRAPYDTCVAGVVSGAGNLRPGIVLGRSGPDDARPTIALTGKVWCFVDADESPIRLGDLLTTSRTPGHAMRAVDPSRAFGAVIGKALGSLASGQGLLPVLVALH
jgi:hypothetical protein